VDITNYVLFEVGHPLHAFDYEKLGGRRIVVRRAMDGEKVVSLDGVERELDSSMLAICDESDPAAVAGVMGGLDSEIDDDSTTILLESAYFEPISIRKTARKLGMSTEASFRFERGADPEIADRALNLASRLIVELCGGRCVSPVIDANPVPYKKRELVLRKDRIKRLLGIEIAEVQVEEILKYLEFDPVREPDGSFKVKVPGFRTDIEFEADLVEEVARHHGYENIPGTYPPPAIPGRISEFAGSEKTIVSYLVNSGFYEAVNYSLTTPAVEELYLGAAPGMTALSNPLTEDATHLRTTLIPGLAGSLHRNLNLGNRDVRLFEIGNVFPTAEVTEEKSFLALAACGSYSRHFLDKEEDPFSFYHLKGILEALMEKFSIPVRFVQISDFSLLHPGMGARIELEDGRPVGFSGQMHPALQEKLKIQEKVFLAEIDTTILTEKPLPSPIYQSYSRYPSIERDLSFLLDRSVEFARIKDEIKDLGLHGLQDICLIDLYQGPNISGDKVSLTVRIVFSDPARTLVQEEVDSACELVWNLLKSRFSAVMR
ncbi:MAG: phenylalanine--tRNA ligase subunit beta, partial [Anaerolineales bacterium]|nr:phenylalanine--tRNA ligase subunit beta [Anaerolineales bacterium]